MYVAFYILYALIQGILINRYFIQDGEEPVFMVIIMAIFAPFVTVCTILVAFAKGIKWLATPRTKQ